MKRIVIKRVNPNNRKDWWDISSANIAKEKIFRMKNGITVYNAHVPEVYAIKTKNYFTLVGETSNKILIMIAKNDDLKKYF